MTSSQFCELDTRLAQLRESVWNTDSLYFDTKNTMAYVSGNLDVLFAVIAVYKNCLLLNIVFGMFPIIQRTIIERRIAKSLDKIENTYAGRNLETARRGLMDAQKIVREIV